jgi:predicted site-specific integrase-resolvase
MTTDIQNEYLLPHQAARVLKISPSCLAKHARSRRIRCQFSPGGHRRYLKTEIEQLAQQLQNQTLEGRIQENAESN